jgi:hypothetical protein
MAVASVGDSTLAKTKILATHHTLNGVDRRHRGTKPAHAVQGSEERERFSVTCAQQSSRAGSDTFFCRTPTHARRGSGSQWKDTRLAIEHPPWPTIIDSDRALRPTLSAPRPTLLILGSQSRRAGSHDGNGLVVHRDAKLQIAHGGAVLSLPIVELLRIRPVAPSGTGEYAAAVLFPAPCAQRPRRGCHFGA